MPFFETGEMQALTAAAGAALLFLLFRRFDRFLRAGRRRRTAWYETGADTAIRRELQDRQREKDRKRRSVGTIARYDPDKIAAALRRWLSDDR